MLGFILGLFLAVDLTWRWSRDGRWQEWAVAGAAVSVSTLACGFAVRRWGYSAVDAILGWFPWW
jgi:hypothetical protein